MDMLGKLQKHVYRTVGLTLITSLETLIRCYNVASLSFLQVFPKAYLRPYQASVMELFLRKLLSIKNQIFLQRKLHHIYLIGS